MLTASRDYVLQALESVGLPRGKVAETQRVLDELPRAPAAYLYWYNGRLKRDGSKLLTPLTKGGAVASVAQSKRTWEGSAVLRLELYLRSLSDLESALVGLGDFFVNHSLVVDSVPHKFPNGEVDLSWVDEAGLLVSYSGVTIDFPVVLGLYKHSSWTPIQVELESTEIGGL
jgi:hypothetical protein